MENSIQVFITGGTFDKSYNYIEGNLFFEKTHLPEMLKRSRCQLNTKVETLMMLDSLEMTEENLEHIITACKNTPSNRIVITHSTYRMAQTAAALAKAQIKGKPSYLRVP